MDRLLVSWLVLAGILGAASSAVAQPTAPTGKAQPPAQAVEPELKSSYGSWGFFKYFLSKDVLLTAAELQGKKRLPGGRRN